MRATNRRANPGGEMDLLLIGGVGIVAFLILRQLGGVGQGLGQAAQGVGSAVGNTGNAVGQTFSAVGSVASSTDRGIGDAIGGAFSGLGSDLHRLFGGQ